MVEPHATSAQAYDPLWNSGAGRARTRKAARFAVILSVVAHAALVAYLYETKVVMKMKVYGDSPITAELIPLPHDPPKPPEPAKPPPQTRPEPPMPLDIRQTRPIPGLELPETVLPVFPPTPTIPPEPAKPVVETPPPRVISNPNWSARPSPDDMARYYPDRAIRLEKPGNVLLQCLVTAKGSVSTCSVLSEDPTEYGFGDAALKLSRLFKLKPGTVDGQAIEGAQVRIPIAFRIG